LLSPADYVLWTAGVIADAVAVVCALRSKSFVKYLALSLYLLADASLSIVRYVLLTKDGFNSPQYYYFYFFSDALLTIFLFFVLMGLYYHVFAELGVGRYVRFAALFLLGATAGISYWMVVASGDKMLGHFVAELSQNLYFVGLVLTYLLWAAVMKLRETRTRLIQFVLSLGVYFSAHAATYALCNLYTRIVIWQYLPPVLGICLPAAWAYTFSQVSDDSRLAVASVAASGPISGTTGNS
jgi:hypothetical protein